METHVAVIGTVFVDCKGFAKQSYYPLSRNLGQVQFVHGGVGRNVAETLAHLGVPVSLVSTCDASGIGDEVVQRLKANQVGITHLRQVDKDGMGMWLVILDEKGELAGSISHMPDVGHLAKVIEEKGDEIVSSCSHLALELDLNGEISEQVLALAHKHNKPVFGIPGNLDVILSHPHLVHQLECFICNHHEAARIWDTDLSSASSEEILAQMKAFVDASTLRSMVITLGEKGCIYYDSKTDSFGHQPVFPVRMVDSTGAGDAFFSGTVSALVRGFKLPVAVLCGTKVAGWTIESPESTCPELKEKVRSDAFFQAMREK
ncbi:carbohydrate kinase family protein [Paenibacillus senegalensis]|uniref:carbohydrate kinase family protein n=1 Tax=Paenibacillus senegalensis TaxID=1465766 RepID=UPI000288CB01|nr:PfkB family carbohydrate kinase [Paenibacillus senegalensis]